MSLRIQRSLKVSSCCSYDSEEKTEETANVELPIFENLATEDLITLVDAVLKTFVRNMVIKNHERAEEYGHHNRHTEPRPEEMYNAPGAGEDFLGPDPPPRRSLCAPFTLIETKS